MKADLGDISDRFGLDYATQLRFVSSLLVMTSGRSTTRTVRGLGRLSPAQRLPIEGGVALFATY
jgi:hypothetical protein